MFVRDAVIRGFLEIQRLLEFAQSVRVRIGIDHVDKQSI